MLKNKGNFYSIGKSCPLLIAFCSLLFQLSFILEKLLNQMTTFVLHHAHSHPCFGM